MKTLLLGIALCALPALSALPLMAAAAGSPSCSKQSPAHTIALLELYTSEGCNSCPPADKFVNGLHGAGLSPDQVVPLSLHVDYWDYTGWKDIFGRRAFTERQRWLSDLAGSRIIYTPEIFVAGRELRNWRGGVAAAVQRINGQPARADIGIIVGKASNGNLPVGVSAKTAQRGHLFVALYENGIASDVKAGENRGMTLRHDYVVREWIGPLALSAGAQGNKAMLTRTLPIPSGAAAHKLGIAAFVQNEQGEVLQTLALPVCAG
jgi:hypothetical protein